MANVFEGPYWEENPNVHLQGFWYRFTLERPHGDDGWVGVIDSAVLRHPHPGCAPLHRHRRLVGIEPIEHATGWGGFRQRDYEGLVSQGSPVLLHAPAPQQDVATSSWVGAGWAKGWATDTMLARGHVHLGATSGKHPMQKAMMGMYTALLQELQDAGFPHGLGWGLPTLPYGRETDRLPWSASAHLRMETAERLGPPRPWDVRTARMSWALMARLRSDLVEAQAA